MPDSRRYHCSVTYISIYCYQCIVGLATVNVIWLHNNSEIVMCYIVNPNSDLCNHNLL